MRFAPLMAFVFLACSGPVTSTEPETKIELPPDGPLQVELQTDLTSYPIGASAEVRMSNRTAEEVGFGGCEDVLERRMGSRWVEVPRLDYPCPAILLGLAPDSSISMPFDLRPATAAGTYRLRRPFVPIHGDRSNPSYRRSNEFTLTK
jgi:hypothetical protein